MTTIICPKCKSQETVVAEQFIHVCNCGELISDFSKQLTEEQKPREVTYHKGNTLNDYWNILASFPSAGGACTEYALYGTGYNGFEVFLKFQNGNPNEEVNGISNEMLLAILIDRMEGFQSGKFACDNNQVALECLKTALVALNGRTAARVSKGIEGTQEI